MVFLIDFFSVIFLLAGVCSQKTVRVKQGEVIGSTRMVRNVTVHSYLGIPYAEPPVGELRFKKPVPKAPWTSPINASDYGPICVQPPNPLLPYARSEDCLTLNVHVPESPVNTSMAVMVWVHGGGYIAGAARQWDPIGVTSMGVILVSINYRLLIFGFLNLGEHLKGNIGIWDQHLAFRWVKENIGAFGGDPERITIFGGSAGAMSVSIHAMSPQSTGLFHRVIGQSGMGMKAVSQKKTPTPTQITRVSLVSGCGTDDVVKLANCLRNKNTNELLFASFGLIGTGLLAPTVDNEFITKLVEDEQFVQSYGDYDYMMGSNNQDGNLAFINATTRATFQNGITNEMFESTIDRASLIYGYRSDAITSATLQEYTGDLTSADNTTRLRRLSEALGDATFTVPAQVNAVKHSMTNGTGSTYLYFLSMNSCTKLLPSFSWLEGSGHSDDLLYMTGVLEVLCNATDADRTLEKAMMTYWTNFAKTGNPNLPEAVPTTWPMFDHTQRQYLELNVNITAQANLKPRRMSFWNNVVQTLVESSSKVDCDDEVTGTPVDTVVETLYGKLRGKRESVKDWFWDVYLGIPYAAPPVGARRFLPPVPPSMWDGVRNATEFGFACHGGPSYPGGPTLTFHEDCLSLNIYVPGGVEMWKEEKLAVMLFIHGGGYSIGSGSEYDGRALSWLGRVIVVTINYRLGIFGFASTGDENAPGNVGLMDQSLAMRWVKHNIASFGGDPKRITIFGQSAGAGAVVYQVLSPMSAGLFQRAIAESSWGGAWDLHFTDPGKKKKVPTATLR